MNSIFWKLNKQQEGRLWGKLLEQFLKKETGKPLPVQGSWCVSVGHTQSERVGEGVEIQFLWVWAHGVTTEFLPWNRCLTLGNDWEGEHLSAWATNMPWPWHPCVYSKDVRGEDVFPLDIRRDEVHGTEAGETLPGMLRSVRSFVWKKDKCRSQQWERSTWSWCLALANSLPHQNIPTNSHLNA